MTERVRTFVSAFCYCVCRIYIHILLYVFPAFITLYLTCIKQLETKSEQHLDLERELETTRNQTKVCERET